MRSIEPGISRFRVWSFGPSRNDGGAAAIRAGGLTVRILANHRSYRPRHSLHRCLADPAWPAAGQDSAQDAAAQPLTGGRRAVTLHCKSARPNPQIFLPPVVTSAIGGPYIVWACRIGWTKLRAGKNKFG